MEMFHLILGVMTGIYLIVCSWWDLKDRMIYTFPCTVLTALWIGYSVLQGKVETRLLIAFIVMFLVLYVTFAITKAWGGGDNDLLLLFGAVYLAKLSGSLDVNVIISLCIGVASVLIIAFFIGWIESRVRKKKLNSHSSIAIAPGFAVVIGVFMIGGFCR